MPKRIRIPGVASLSSESRHTARCYEHLKLSSSAAALLVALGMFLMPVFCVAQEETGSHTSGVEIPGFDALATPVIHTCGLGASGDTCVFDLRATADGTLQVCTRPKRTQQRWRASIVQTNVRGAVSNVGTGSETAFSGCVSRPVVNGVFYELLTSYDRPLPGVFPTGADVRISGPVSFLFPAPRTRSGIGPEEPQSCSQLTESGAVVGAAADMEVIGCGTLMGCKLTPVGDSDIFKFAAPAGSAVSISSVRNPSEAGTPCWRLFDSSGILLTGWVCGHGNLPLSQTTAQTYTVEMVEASFDQNVDYTLSFHGVSQSFSCGTPIAYGDLKSGKIDIVGDLDVFNFTGKQGEDASINIVRTGGPGAPCWRLFGPNGVAVTGWVCGQGTPALPLTGKYSIEVAEASYDQTVDYRLSLQRVGAP